jgi:hypothetical protein
MAVGVLALGGCADENLFSTCPLSKSITETCAEQAGDQATFTCVVADHPYCNQSICASWLGSATFCTRSCSSNGDCEGTPSPSTCEVHLAGEAEELHFCVPDNQKPESP